LVTITWPSFQNVKQNAASTVPHFPGRMGHIPNAARQQHSLLEEEYLDTLALVTNQRRAPADPAAQRAPWIKGASGTHRIKGWMGSKARAPENGPRFLAHPNPGLVITH